MKPISLPKFTLEKNALKDQIILITGATRGLGRCLALKIAEYGATTILMGSNLKKLESVYDEIVENGWIEPALQPINFLGAGPKDSFTIALMKKTNKSINQVKFLVEGGTFALGVVIGGPFGLGTVISTLFTGRLLSIFFKQLRYDPALAYQK